MNHALEENGCVALIRNAGTSTDDNSVELLFLLVFIVRDGRIANVEHYPSGALEDALARVDELRRPACSH